MYEAANPVWSNLRDGAGMEASNSALLDVLRDRRRWLALRILDDGGATDLGPLAESVAAAASADGDVDEDQARRVRTRLHHVHLPKLEDAALVDYDPEARRVRPTTDDLDVEALGPPPTQP